MKPIDLIKGKKNLKVRTHKYYKCDRCGYVSIVKNSFCPICTKDGYSIKLK